MSLTVKLGLATVSLGVAGGLGYAGFNYLNSNEEKPVAQKTESKISDLIEEGFKYKLLDTKANDEATVEFWKRNWNSYKTENASSEKGKDPFKLASWTKQNSEDLTAELKAACEKESPESANDKTNPIYKNVEKYCTRGVTVKEEAEKKGKEILNTQNPDGDTKAWTQRHSSKTALKDSLSKLGITNIGDETTADIIKKTCADSVLKNKKDYSNYTEIYEAYEKVCTKQEGDK